MCRAERSLRGPERQSQRRAAYRKALLAVHPDKHVDAPPDRLALATARLHLKHGKLARGTDTTTLR